MFISRYICLVMYMTKKGSMEKSCLPTAFWREGERERDISASSLSSLSHWPKFPHQEVYSLTLPLLTLHLWQPLRRPDLMFCNGVLHLNLEWTGKARVCECVVDWLEEVDFCGSARAIAKAKQSQNL